MVRIPTFLWTMKHVRFGCHISQQTTHGFYIRWTHPGETDHEGATNLSTDGRGPRWMGGAWHPNQNRSTLYFCSKHQNWTHLMAPCFDFWVSCYMDCSWWNAMRFHPADSPQVRCNVLPNETTLQTLRWVGGPKSDVLRVIGILEDGPTQKAWWFADIFGWLGINIFQEYLKPSKTRRYRCLGCLKDVTYEEGYTVTLAAHSSRVFVYRWWHRWW